MSFIKRFKYILFLLLVTLYPLSNIKGQEVIKYASDYGFSVDNDGGTNSVALQDALKGGGKVVVDKPGTYNVSRTCFIESNTELCFADGVVLNKCKAPDGNLMSYMFINRHAFDRTYDENIKIDGLNIEMNDMDNGFDVGRVVGLVGTVSFFYIRNLEITNFKSVNGGRNDFVIQICTFENILLENVFIEGDKDGIHLGRGRNFLIRNGKFKTYDDPIALNAHDYKISNPELGWIEEGLIENCYDLNSNETVGFFCRILAGAWPRWEKGMTLQNSDAVISNGKIYRLTLPFYERRRSYYKPTHATGTQKYPDGIEWTMVQENDVTDHCGVRNVHFKDIYLQKRREYAFSFHFDIDEYSRSFYPNCTPPKQTGIIFENIYQQNELDGVVHCVTPVDTIKFVNSEIYSMVDFHDIHTDGCKYDTQYVVFDGVTFTTDKPNYMAVRNEHKLDVKVIFRKCDALNKNVNINVGKDVEVLSFKEGRSLKACSREGRLFVDLKYDNNRVYLYDVNGLFLGDYFLTAKHNCIYGLSDGVYILRY